MDFDDWTAIGRILLRRGALTEKQLTRALDEQESRKTTRLGDLLVDLKICDRDEVNAAVREQELTRIPPATTEATLTAQETLRAAFARVEEETRKLEENRKPSTVLSMKISEDS